MRAMLQEALRFTSRQMGMNLWQKSYFDHIIRREGDFSGFGNISTAIRPNGWRIHIM